MSPIAHGILFQALMITGVTFYYSVKGKEPLSDVLKNTGTAILLTAFFGTMIVWFPPSILLFLLIYTLIGSL